MISCLTLRFECYMHEIPNCVKKLVPLFSPKFSFLLFIKWLRDKDFMVIFYFISFYCSSIPLRSHLTTLHTNFHWGSCDFSITFPLRTSNLCGWALVLLVSLFHYVCTHYDIMFFFCRFILSCHDAELGILMNGLERGWQKGVSPMSVVDSFS